MRFEIEDVVIKTFKEFSKIRIEELSEISTIMLTTFGVFVEIKVRVFLITTSIIFGIFIEVFVEI